MLAGQLSCGRELASMYTEYLDSDSCETLTEHNLLDHLRIPPRKLKEKLVEEYFRLKWAVSYEQFLDGKLNALRESELLRIGSDINNIVFPDNTCAILASLATGVPSLFTVYPDGQVFQDENFTVIGTGYSVARATLTNRHYHQHWNLPYALYAIYEAKRLCEGDPNVGPATIMWVHYLNHAKEQVMLPLEDADIEFLREQFEKFGPRKLSKTSLPPSLEKCQFDAMVKEDEQKALPESAQGDGGKGSQK